MKFDDNNRPYLSDFDFNSLSYPTDLILNENNLKAAQEDLYWIYSDFKDRTSDQTYDCHVTTILQYVNPLTHQWEEYKCDTYFYVDEKHYLGGYIYYDEYLTDHIIIIGLPKFDVEQTTMDEYLDVNKGRFNDFLSTVYHEFGHVFFMLKTRLCGEHPVCGKHEYYHNLFTEKYADAVCLLGLGCFSKFRKAWRTKYERFAELSRDPRMALEFIEEGEDRATQFDGLLEKFPDEVARLGIVA